MRLIESEADLSEGVAWLAQADPVMAAIFQAAGLPPLRRRAGGFEGLCSIVIAQQVSVASARAIWNRTLTVLGELTVARVLAATDDDLKRCGLSRPKQATLRACAGAIADGHLDLAALATMAADDIRSELTAIRGIGGWTADIYALTCVGHGDAFASGDLALREAARQACGFPERPQPRELEAHAERWRPWRGVAARLLWSYYALAKGREGLTA
ncbi:DNA-3-methyladenine glycosylase family protein [Pseudochelatococcus lubricantis]|uniref:DNA-3-methyladenine glycosylase family protein n=1 Tax=Pseudochelatococcus lubricantis TaxID=1538102 RepID=UPI0035ED758F